MGSDQALTDAGTNFASGEAVYTIAIFGTPSPDKPWMIEFGGHHLGLNVVIAVRRCHDANAYRRSAWNL